MISIDSLKGMTKSHTGKRQLGSQNLQDLKNELLSSVEILSENAEWTKVINNYFDQDPGKLDQSFREC